MQNWTTDTDVMDEQNFVRFKFKMSFGEITYIATDPCNRVIWYLRIPSSMCRHQQWRHNERNDVSNHRRLDCFLNRLFRHRSKKTSKLCVTGLCEGNPPVTGGFTPQRASNAENVFIWWHHHVRCSLPKTIRLLPSFILDFNFLHQPHVAQRYPIQPLFLFEPI